MPLFEVPPPQFTRDASTNIVLGCSEPACTFTYSVDSALFQTVASGDGAVVGAASDATATVAVVVSAPPRTLDPGAAIPSDDSTLAFEGLQMPDGDAAPPSASPDTEFIFRVDDQPEAERGGTLSSAEVLALGEGVHTVGARHVAETRSGTLGVVRTPSATSAWYTWRQPAAVPAAAALTVLSRGSPRSGPAVVSSDCPEGARCSFRWRRWVFAREGTASDGRGGVNDTTHSEWAQVPPGVTAAVRCGCGCTRLDSTPLDSALFCVVVVLLRCWSVLW